MITGFLGDHEIAIISKRENLGFVTHIQSDEEVLSVIKKTRYGSDAQIIGEVIAEPRGKVLMRTGIGGTRIVDMLATEQFPRIC